MKLFNVIKKGYKKIAGAVAAASTMVMLTVFSFAAAGDSVAFTSADLEPILQGAKDNIAVIIPVAVGLFAITLGISFLPTILKKFKKG